MRPVSAGIVFVILLAVALKAFNWLDWPDPYSLC